MIGGRTNVGDVQSRRLLAILDLKENKTSWADASAFAGVERKAKPSDPDVPRLLNWGAPDVSDDGTYTVVAVRSLDNKDRWFVKIDPATGKATVLDWLHDDAWIREQTIGGGGGGFGGGAGITLAARQQAFLFLSEKDGYMHLYSLDMSAATPAGEAAHHRQVGGDERAALERSAHVLPHDERGASRASGTSTRCRSTAARARRSRPRPARTTSPCRPTRSRSRSSTPTAPNRRSSS